MGLAEILVGRGLVSLEAVQAALERQRREGGRLGDFLVAAGALTADQLASAMISIDRSTPHAPRSLADVGIAQSQLTSLMLKLMLVEARGSASDLSRAMKLPFHLVQTC